MNKNDSPSESATATADAIDVTTLELNGVFIGIMRTTAKRGEAFSATYDLTPARVAVISFLHRHARPLTVGEIAAGLHVSSTNISRRLDGLQRDGWIQRDPNPADARSIYVSLTDEGRQKADEIMPVIYRRLDIVWSCFSPDEKQALLGYLGRFLEHVQNSPQLGALGPD